MSLNAADEAEDEPRAGSAGLIRAADADRDEVAERLRAAAVEGQLDTEELTRRLDAAYSSKTYGELETQLADLPSELVLRTGSGIIDHGGRWRIPRRILARCTAGQITIDFTEALSFHREVTVEATCGSGWITLVVPQGWEVRIDPSSTGLDHVVNRVRSAAAPGGPTLVMIAHPGSGYVRIKQAR